MEKLNFQNEIKSKNTMILVRPSVWEKFKQLAYIHRTSANDLLNRFMIKFVEEHWDDLDQYETLRSQTDNLKI